MSTSFPLRIHNPGNYRGNISIDDGILAVDDTRWLTVEVADRLTVLCVSDANLGDESTGVHWLARALDPFRDGTAGPVGVKTLTGAQCDSVALDEGQVVFMHGVGTLRPAALNALIRYLRDGGSVVYFLTSETDTANLEALAEASKGDLDLPFATGALVVNRPEDDPPYAALSAANYDHPILRRFKQEGALDRIRFYRHFQTRREEGRAHELLLRFDDGAEAMAEKAVGMGTMVICNFSLALEGSNIARSPSFLPFVHEIVRAVRPQSGGARDFAVGAPASVTLTVPEDAAGLRFEAPDGSPIDAEFDRVGNEVVVIFAETPLPGLYSALAQDEQLGAVPVNVDARESNLDALTAEQLEELSRKARRAVTAVPDARAGTVRALLGGTELWHYFLLAGLALMAGESILAMMWRR